LGELKIFYHAFEAYIKYFQYHCEKRQKKKKEKIKKNKQYLIANKAKSNVKQYYFNV